MAYCKVQKELAKNYLANEIPRKILDLSTQNEFTMVGLVTFENKLKAETKEAIDKLSNSKIQTKIITGDNIYIAIETAYRSGILPNRPLDNKVIVIKGKKQKDDK